MNRPRHALSRRHLLQGLGLGGLALGAGLGRGRPAIAGPGDIPRRIIFFYGAGMLYDFWEPTASMGKPTPEEYDFQLGELHAPLQPFKDRAIILDGIGMVSEETDQGEPGNAHNQGAKHALAPYDSVGPDLPGGTSIDQFIAKALNEPTAVTPHASLVLQAAGWTNELTLFSGAVASGPGALVPGIWDPRIAYDKVFGMFQGGDDPKVIDQLRAQRAAVFGLAADDFGGLQSRVGTSDAQRLQIHLDLLRDLEQRLELQDSLTCTRPDAFVTPPGNFEKYDSTYFAGNYNLSADLHSQLITASLACDLTRVVTLEMQYPGDADFGYTAGQFDTTDAHDLVHKVNDKNSAQYQVPRPSPASARCAQSRPRSSPTSSPCSANSRGRRQDPARPHPRPLLQPDRLRQPRPRAPALGRRRRRRRPIQDRPLHQVRRQSQQHPRPAPQQPLRLPRQRDGHQHRHLRQPERLHRPARPPHGLSRCLPQLPARCSQRSTHSTRETRPSGRVSFRFSMTLESFDNSRARMTKRTISLLLFQKSLIFRFQKISISRKISREIAFYFHRKDDFRFQKIPISRKMSREVTLRRVAPTTS